MSRMAAFLKGSLNYQIKKIFAQAALFAVLIAVAVTVFLASYAQGVVKNLADNLIRLHVVANSDTQEDQSLKMIVRDRVIEYMNEKLKDSKDIEHTKNIINDNASEILRIAEEEVKKAGKDYGAAISLGQFPFPTKVYGDVTLPAGEYQALKIVLGKGQGQNWWCVLFPPLCFVDATHGVIPESVKNDLKESLSEEEYNIITTASTEGEIPIRVKFKIVEIFQQSQLKVAETVSRLIR